MNPPGKETAESVLSALDKLKLRPVYLFDGPEEFQKIMIINKIRSLFLNDLDLSLNYESLSFRTSSARDILDKCLTTPFLGKIRMIVVHDLEKAKDADRSRFLEYFRQPASFTCLVLLTSEYFRDSSFTEEVSRCGSQVTFWHPFRNQLERHIRELAAAHSKYIDGPGVKLLADLFPDSLAQVSNEIVKLVDLIGQKDTITETDILMVCDRTEFGGFYALLETIVEKERARAFSNFSRMERDRSDVLILVNSFFRHFKTILAAQEQIEKGGTNEEIMKRLRISLKQKRSFLGSIARWKTPAPLITKITELLRMDAGIKGQAGQKNIAWDFLDGAVLK